MMSATRDDSTVELPCSRRLLYCKQQEWQSVVLILNRLSGAEWIVLKPYTTGVSQPSAGRVFLTTETPPDRRLADPECMAIGDQSRGTIRWPASSFSGDLS